MGRNRSSELAIINFEDVKGLQALATIVSRGQQQLRPPDLERLPKQWLDTINSEAMRSSIDPGEPSTLSQPATKLQN